MSRRFYLPPRHNDLPPKPEHPLWQRLRLGLMVVGAFFVTLLVWWYFTDQERWEGSSTRQLNYLGSTTRDTTTLLRGRAEIPVSPPSVVRSEPQAAVRQPLVEHPVRIELWNACGEKGLAQRATSALRSRGTYFDIRGTGNAEKGRQEFSSVIGRTADTTLAFAIADSLGIADSRVVTEIPKSARDIDVTVIIGADYPHLRFGLKSDTKE